MSEIAIFDELFTKTNNLAADETDRTMNGEDP